MRRLRYGVAMSLDGYIAGPNGEYDWIPQDPDIDFGEIFNRFDTLVMGRKTFELTRKSRELTDPQYEGGAHPAHKTVVISRTLRAADYPDVTIIGGGIGEALSAMKAQPGKDIWLIGGGGLFRSLLELGQVDALDVAVMPVLLGGGIPFLPGAARKATLRLEKQRLYEKSGIVMLEYAVEPAVVS